MLRATPRLFTVVLLLSITACGPKNPNAPARVSGVVTYKGEALKAGNIIFHTLDDKGAFQSSIGTDGTYEVFDLPAGTHDVTVETESVNPGRKVPAYGGNRGAKMSGEQAKAMGKAAGGPNAQELAGRYRAIPKKYANRKTSGLTATIAPGRQNKDFDLTD